jgi:predicted DCC family thiol-disulfide oxidoreductase YuxK
LAGQVCGSGNRRTAPTLHLADHREHGYNCVVKFADRVAARPAKPLMIFDGDCNFCIFWIRRWQRRIGDRLECLPFQDPQIAARFPEIPREQFEAAVQLILTDGMVYSGAEAVFRSRALHPDRQRLLKWYERSRAFARMADCSYRFVAKHRMFFSRLTRLVFGAGE